MTFKSFILQFNFLEVLCIQAYRNNLQLRDTYLPQVIMTFEDNWPEECIDFQSSQTRLILLSCYNWTNLVNFNLQFQDSIYQQTYVLPEIESSGGFGNLLKLADHSGLTTVQYIWLANYVVESSNFDLKNLAIIVNNTRFRARNPLSIQFNHKESKAKDISKDSVKIFKLDTIHPQTQIHFANSIFDLRNSPDNFLSGSLLEVAGVNDSIYDFDTKVEIGVDHRPKFVGGFSAEVLRGLQHILNFSVNAVVMSDWGYKVYESGEWTGMVKGAIDGKLDVAISSSAAIPARWEVIDFNMHTHINELSAFFRRYSGYLLNPLLLPFENTLWFSILLWMWFSRIIYLIFQYLIYYHLSKVDDSSLDEKNLIPWMFSPITFRGIPQQPKLIPLRALYFAELVVTVVINAAFSGTLISYLSVDYNPIKTVADVVKSGYNIEILDYKLTIDDLKMSTDPVANSLYRRSLQYERPNKGTERPIKAIVNNPKLAYIINELGGYGEMNSHLNILEACTIQYIRMNNYYLKQGTFVRKGSQLRRIIDHGLLKMMETGIISVFRKRYLTQGPNCYRSNEFSGADIFDLQLAFVMIMIVYSATIAMCAIENIWFNCGRYCQQM